LIEKENVTVAQILMKHLCI